MLWAKVSAWGEVVNRFCLAGRKWSWFRNRGLEVGFMPVFAFVFSEADLGSAAGWDRPVADNCVWQSPHQVFTFSDVLKEKCLRSMRPRRYHQFILWGVSNIDNIKFLNFFSIHISMFHHTYVLRNFSYGLCRAEAVSTPEEEAKAYLGGIRM